MIHYYRECPTPVSAIDDAPDASQVPIPARNGTLTFAIAENAESPGLNRFAAGMMQVLQDHGHACHPLRNGAEGNGRFATHKVNGSTPRDSVDVDTPIGLVINLTTPDHPRRIYRKGQGTYVASVIETETNGAPVLKSAYPYLLRTLSNMLILLHLDKGKLQADFITPELGHYHIECRHGEERIFFEQIYKRLAPLANSHLMIKNIFEPDLPKSLWNGDEATKTLADLGRTLNGMGLLPSAFPIQELLSQEDMQHLKRLYGLGGLSYGNMSTRAAHDPSQFWISASGVDKGNLQVIGRDILLVKGFDAERQAILMSVPPNIEPRHASVDTIEHVMIYREHPSVGAVLHVHSWWSDPIPVTQTNYPCGTIELATEVADLVRQAGDPSKAIIGLKNHGLTITGTSISDILERVLDKILTQVPMA